MARVERTKYQFQIEPQLSKIHQDKELDVLCATRHVRIFLIVGTRFCGKSHLCHVAQDRFGVLTVRGKKAGARLFLEVLRVLRVARRSLDGTLPTIFVDDFDTPSDIAPLLSFFLPKPRLLRLDASKQIRLDRAKTVEPGTWTARSLATVDAAAAKHLRLFSDLELAEFDTTNGLDALLRDLEQRCTLKTPTAER